MKLSVPAFPIAPSVARGIFAGLCLLLSGVALAIHVPGHLSVDSTIQLHEAFLGQAISWAPPLMSAILAWLGFGTISTSLFVLLNVAMTYGGFMLAAGSRMDAPWSGWRLGVACVLAANPVVFTYVGIVWKDVLLASMCTLSFGSCVAAYRSRDSRMRFMLLVLAMVTLLPTPMVRQQAIFLMPVAALSPAWMLLRLAPPERRKRAGIGIFAACVVFYVLLQAAVAHTVPPAADGGVSKTGGSISVGTRILMAYDIAGIEAGVDSEGPMAKAGAPRNIVEEAQREYGADRVDHLLGEKLKIGGYFAGLGNDGVRRLWFDAVLSEPLSYIVHRLDVYAWLIGLRPVSRCLPFHVGVDGIDGYMRESGFRQELELRDAALFSWNQKFVASPIWRHWLYLAALGLLGAISWHRRRSARPALMPWFAGLGLFALSFLPTSIACDFRYLYVMLPTTMALAIFLLAPNPPGVDLRHRG